MRRVFFGHLDPTSTPVVQPGQLKVPTGPDNKRKSFPQNDNRCNHHTATTTYSCDSLGSGRPKATTGKKGVITMVSTAREGKREFKSLKSSQQPETQRRGPTILGVGVEGRKLRLGLCDDFLPVHALLQPLKHALLSDSLDVPSEKSQIQTEDHRFNTFTEHVLSALAAWPVRGVCTFSVFSHPAPASCGVSNTHHLPAAEGTKDK